jgi:glycosyltransferase involved in cell wall biosynthesis
MYNCEKQILRVLGQLTEEVCSFLSEVIIINNKSTDSGEEAVKTYLENHSFTIPVVLFRNDENYGLGGSHKVAFQYAMDHEIDYVICLHGDDQGSIADFMPMLREGSYKNYDCLLGARFMKGAELKGYSKLRIVGNYGFNWIFSAVVRHKVYDLGSGLNMYKTGPLKTHYYIKFPDTLYFNDCMILAFCYFRQNICFVPISWREEDQVSNNKLLNFSISLLKMLSHYIRNKDAYIHSEMRTIIRKEYPAQVIYSTEGGIK